MQVCRTSTTTYPQTLITLSRAYPTICRMQRETALLGEHNSRTSIVNGSNKSLIPFGPLAVTSAPAVLFMFHPSCNHRLVIGGNGGHICASRQTFLARFEQFSFNTTHQPFGALARTMALCSCRHGLAGLPPEMIEIQYCRTTPPGTYVAPTMLGRY